MGILNRKLTKNIKKDGCFKGDKFCHNHPVLEQAAALKDHVIIHKKDWEIVQSLKINPICCICGDKLHNEAGIIGDVVPALRRNLDNLICSDCRTMLLNAKKE